jgi:molecular chaperone GrpE
MSKHKTEEPSAAPSAGPTAKTAAAAGASTPTPLSGDGAAGGADESLPALVPPKEWTPAEIEDLQSKANQAQQWYDQLLRTAADLDNYKKRAARERQDAVRYANQSLMQKLVPMLDHFDMAMAAASGPNTTVQALESGIAMIQQQLKSALAEAGLEEIDAQGKAFDPAFQEAVAQEESTQVEEGRVLRQLRKGYRFRDRLLRPAAVVVAKSAKKE